MSLYGGRGLSDAPGPVEKEEKLLRRWKKRAKGKPMRWRILRATVAVLTLDWMNTSQMQIAMRRLYALKNLTTRAILEELEQGGSVRQSKDPAGFFSWEATPSGVAAWVGKASAIPASIVQVASASKSVNVLEA